MGARLLLQTIRSELWCTLSANYCPVSPPKFTAGCVLWA
jgi:hypothetical protein